MEAMPLLLGAKELVSQVESAIRYCFPASSIVSRLICPWGQCHQEGHWASGKSSAPLLDEWVCRLKSSLPPKHARTAAAAKPNGPGASGPKRTMFLLARASNADRKDTGVTVFWPLPSLYL